MVRRAVAAVVGGIRFGRRVIWMRVRHGRLDPAALGTALREYFDSMGFAYVKMGQFLALRFDILPPEMCDELRKLFDRAAPVPFEQITTTIEHELGGPIGNFFTDVDPVAVAAASLAQVHVGTALDGQRVALKVQRSGSREDFEADVRLAGFAAAFVDKSRILRSLSLTEMLDEFKRFTDRELDFITEGQVAAMIRRRTDPNVRVPAIRADLSTQRLLTMEYIEGRSLQEAIRLVKDERWQEYEQQFGQVDIAEVVRTMASESFRQILIDGLFHADPHPGNILIDNDGAVVYLDFGMFGMLTPERRDHCFGYIENASLGRPERSFDHFFRLVTPTPDLDRTAFRTDMVRLMREWAEWSADNQDEVADRHLGAIITKTLTTMRTNGARLDTDLLLFWRVLFVLDSVALDLAGHVDLIQIMRDFFHKHPPHSRLAIDRLVELDVLRSRPYQDGADFLTRCARVADGDNAAVVFEQHHVRATRSARWGDAVLIGTAVTSVVGAVLLRM